MPTLHHDELCLLLYLTDRGHPKCKLSIGFSSLACGIHIWHKQVPVIQADLEDLIVVHV